MSDWIDRQTPRDPRCDTKLGEPVVEVTIGESPRLIQLKNELEYVKYQLGLVQNNYKKVCDWMRERGIDPVAIATGVEIGERVRVVPSECGLCGQPIEKHEGDPSEPGSLLVCPRGERVEVED